MNQTAAIGVNCKGFDRLLSARFYAQIARLQLEYGLAISSIPPTLIKQFENYQKQCIRRIFRGGARSSYKAMLHLINQPTMKERVHLLQAKFLMRSVTASEDTLLSQFLPYLCLSTSRLQWHKLSKTPVWKRCAISNIDFLDVRTFKGVCKTYLQDKFDSWCNETNSRLISACRPQLIIDLILWLLMSQAERSRTIRWRLGWLPGVVLKPCIYHPKDIFTKSYAITCLQMPHTIADPLSFLLNKLPHRKKTPTAQHRLRYSAWSVRWPTLCQFLFKLDCLHHGKTRLKLLLLAPNL
jgi:hypothetical protein